MNMKSIEKAAQTYSAGLRQKAIENRPSLEEKFKISVLSDDAYIYWYKKYSESRKFLFISTAVVVFIFLSQLMNNANGSSLYIIALAFSLLGGFLIGWLLDLQEKKSQALAEQLTKASQAARAEPLDQLPPENKIFDVPPQE